MSAKKPAIEKAVLQPWPLNVIIQNEFFKLFAATSQQGTSDPAGSVDFNPSIQVGFTPHVKLKSISTFDCSLATLGIQDDSELPYPPTYLAQFSPLAKLQFTSRTGGLKCLSLWSVVVAPDESVSCHEPCWHFHHVCSALAAWAGGSGRRQEF